MKNILSEFNLRLKDDKLCIKSIVYYVEDESKYIDVVFVNKMESFISSFDYEIKCKDEKQNEIIAIPSIYNKPLEVGKESSIVTIKLPRNTEHIEINFDSCIVECDINVKESITCCFISEENTSNLAQHKYLESEVVTPTSSNASKTCESSEFENKTVSNKETHSDNTCFKKAFSTYGFVTLCLIFGYELLSTLIPSAIYNSGMVVFYTIVGTTCVTMACVWNIISIVNFIKSLTKRGWEPFQKIRLIYTSLAEFLVSNTYTFLAMYGLMSKILPMTLTGNDGVSEVIYLLELNLLNGYIGFCSLVSIIVQLCFIKKVAKIGYENSKDRSLVILLWIISILAQAWSLLFFTINLSNINNFSESYILFAYILATVVSIVILVYGIMCKARYNTGSHIQNHFRFATYAIILGIFITLISGIGLIRTTISFSNPVYDENGKRINTYGNSALKSSGDCYAGNSYGFDKDYRNKYYTIYTEDGKTYKFDIRLRAYSKITVYIYEANGRQVSSTKYSDSSISFKFKASQSKYYIKFVSKAYISSWSFEEAFVITPFTKLSYGQSVEDDSGFSFAGEFIQLNTQKYASYKVSIHKEGYSKITISLYDSNSNLVDQISASYSNLNYTFDSKDTKYYIIVETSDRVYYMGLDNQ